MLAARHSISPERAFERLRSLARNRSVTVQAVAEAVVRLGLDP
jgi:AmiR/NasT family two-component response regulator